MNNQIIFWMNKFFEWIFLLYYWMNFWMNQKSAIFIRKMNKKCVLSKKRPILHVFSQFFTVFHCFLKLWFVFKFEWIILLNEYFWFNFEWMILLNEYSRFNFELNIELNHFFARFNVKMNNQNISATPRRDGGGGGLEQGGQQVNGVKERVWGGVLQLQLN